MVSSWNTDGWVATETDSTVPAYLIRPSRIRGYRVERLLTMLNLRFPDVATLQLAFLTDAELGLLWDWVSFRVASMEGEGHKITRVWVYEVESDAARESLSVEGCIASVVKNRRTVQRFGLRYSAGQSLSSFVSGKIEHGTQTRFTLFGPPQPGEMVF